MKKRINIYSEIHEELLNKLETELTDFQGDTLEIHINSAGGNVLTGLKIISLLNSLNCKKECYIEFLAASMAADLAMICDKVYMSKYGLLMFHGVQIEDEGELSDSGKNYQKLQSEMLLKLVCDKRNLDQEVFKSYQKEEKWFTADESLKFGLIDEIYETEMYKEIELEEIYKKSFKEIMEMSKKITEKMELVTEEILDNVVKEQETTIEEVIEEVTKEVVEQVDVRDELIIKLQEELNYYKKIEQETKEKELETKIESFLENSVKEGKITNKNDWKELLKSDFNKFSRLITDLPTAKKSPSILSSNFVKQLDERENWTWLDWIKKDSLGLQKLKKDNFYQFNEIYKKQFKKDYNS